MKEVISRPPGGFALRARPLLVALVALFAPLAVAAAPAGAENVHVLTQTVSGFGPTKFENPLGVAVDNSSGPSAGDFYVSDTSHHRVEKFNAAGNFLLMWGKEVNEGTGNPNLCTNVGPPTDKCKFGVYANGEGLTAQPSAIAVDSSSGPSAGDVYVIGGESNYGIEKFDPGGHVISSWGGSPYPGSLDGSNSPSGPFPYSLEGIDVDASGHLSAWIPNESRLFTFAEDGTALTSFRANTRESTYGGFTEGGGKYFKLNRGAEPEDSIEMFGPTGTDIGQVNTGTAPTRGLAYDASRDDLFTIATHYPVSGPTVDMYHFSGAGEVVQADSTTCKPAPNAGCSPTESFGSEDFPSESGYPNGIGINESNGAVYVSVLSETASRIQVFKPINVPVVTTGAATGLARDSVMLNGHVDPDGAGEVSTCEFEYGTTRTYGSSAPCVPASTTTATDVSTQLPDGTLASATTYHYRLVAGNSNGDRPAKDLTFTTPPAVGDVTTGGTADLGKLTATLDGGFTGDGVDTAYHFEYGPTTSYGQSTPDVDQGTAGGAQSISATIDHLYAYYIYHYRLVTHNKYGTTVGADKSFRTLPPELPVVESSFSSGVAGSGATLNAAIDPGEGLTVYRFEYGPGLPYGFHTLVAGPIDPEGPSHTATASLPNLSPGITYHFRVVATNFSGTTFGPDETFTTQSPPSISSLTATGLTRTSATLGATINPGLSLTTYHFEYGPSPSYGSRTMESGAIGSDNADHPAAAALSGLAPGTVYHYRVVATNSIGPAYGSDQTFTTLPAAEPGNPGEGAKPCRKGFVKKNGKCLRKRRPAHNGAHHPHRGGGRG